MPSSTLQLVKEPKAYQHINQVSISIEILCPRAWDVSNITQNKPLPLLLLSVTQMVQRGNGQVDDEHT